MVTGRGGRWAESGDEMTAELFDMYSFLCFFCVLPCRLVFFCSVFRLCFSFSSHRGPFILLPLSSSVTRISSGFCIPVDTIYGDFRAATTCQHDLYHDHSLWQFRVRAYPRVYATSHASFCTLLCANQSVLPKAARFDRVSSLMRGQYFFGCILATSTPNRRPRCAVTPRTTSS